MSKAAVARVGAASESITEALLLAHPEWREREVVDDLRVTALYAEFRGRAVCLLAYDICEISRLQALRLRDAVGRGIGVDPACVHVYCSHTHSSSCENDHDLDALKRTSIKAAQEAKQAAAPVESVDFLRVDTGHKYNINRRTVHGPLGTWCLMQSRGCTDDGAVVDGTEWVGERLRQFGATAEEVGEVQGPFPATRPNDPNLDLVLFPKATGGYAGGFVRFTAHAVVCSAGYWRPNMGRDYPGVLCDRLAEAFGCPILFLQGPCGDHRPRHRDVGIVERDRIANGLADELIGRREQVTRVPFDALTNETALVRCPLVEDFPADRAEAAAALQRVQERLDALPRGIEHLSERKALAERAAFYDHARNVLAGRAYLRPEDLAQRAADLEVSLLRFGRVRLLNLQGELFSTVTRGLLGAGEEPTVIASFCDGVTGYLMPPDDFSQGGYERTWALFDPDAIADVRTTALSLTRRAVAGN